jgi:hypothetical protein
LVLADAAKRFAAGGLEGGADDGIFVGRGLGEGHWRLQIRWVLT